KNRTNRIGWMDGWVDESIDRRNLLQEYVHVVMEAQKPLDLLSASGTSRKAGRIIQSKSKCLRTRVAKGVSQTGGVGEREAGSPLSREPDAGLDPRTLGS
uniref:Uncharacterized protein n=1 Tax=Ursus americanus TaxID=9643 RepID=A0A452SDD4_URSAM